MGTTKLNPLSCLGGKFGLINKYIPIIEHCAKMNGLRGYAEITGGGSKVLANINPYLFPYRVYNEIERGVANFIATLCDKEKTRSMINTIERLIKSYTPSDLFKLAYDEKDKTTIDMVLSASYTFIVTYGSNSTDREKFFEAQLKNEIIQNRRHLNLTDFNPVFKDVVVTCGDCFYYLKKYKHRKEFFVFLDPPYVGTDSYKSDFPLSKHEDMVTLLLDCEMKVMLCGYDDDDDNYVYKRLERNGWNKYFTKEIAVPSSKTGRRVKEFIWCNFEIPRSLLIDS